MIKTVLKETFIMLMLCAVIALILAVFFYDYIPINKVVPEPIAYSMPEELTEVKEELQNSITNANEKVVMTYEIDESDLAGYKQTKTYDAGKANPFEAYSEETAPEQTEENNSTNTTENNSSGTATTSENKTNSTSTGTLFEKGNTK